MVSMDKMGMVVTVVILAAALGFTLTGGSGSPSDIPATVSPAIKQVKELREDIEPVIEKIKDTAEKTEQVLEETKVKLEETKEAVEKGVQIAEELASTKSTVRLVSIPEGTAIPGCEEEDLCYDPPHIIIFEGTEVTWKNDDTAAHTVTSGSPQDGPAGKFDSSLVIAGDTYSYKFEDKGEYVYFCMVHPWMIGSVSVQ